jgi:hypothetical protein
MPDRVAGSNTRRAWRVMAAAGCLLGALSLTLHGLGFQERQETAYRSERAICAFIVWSEDSVAESTPEQRAQDPDGTARFVLLIRRMRATGVKCPAEKRSPIPTIR